MELIDRVKGWFGKAKAAPTERKVTEMLAAGGISEDKFPNRVDGKDFAPGTTYFGLRLAGLHLRDGRRFLTQQLPLAVCLAEFESGGDRRTVPFSIGPDVIRQKLKDAGVKEDLGKPAWVELRDLTVVRPTPVNEANLSLYAGLFSVPGDDLVKTLLNVVGTVGTALGNPEVAPALKVTEKIYDSFGALLGFNQVDPLVTALVGNALTERGSGYLLIANIDPQQFDVSKARVVGGRLHWPAGQNGGQMITDFDHALLALERFETVAEEGIGLAESLFGKAWAAVRKATKRDAAADALEKLRDTISASPDLTEDDRLNLLGAYGRAAEKLAEARWGPPKAALARSAGGTGLGSRVDGEVAMLDKAGKQEVVANRLRNVVTGLAMPFDLPNPEQTEAGPNRDADMKAILGLAQAMRTTEPVSPADAGRAAKAVAAAIGL